MTSSKVIWTAVIVCFFPLCVRSQGKFVQKYEYLAHGQTEGATVPFTFYYVVDSSTSFKYRGTTFYEFTFSGDSAEKSGLIGYDSKSGDLYFATDSSKDVKENTAKLFRLKTDGRSTVNHIMALSNTLKRTENKDAVTFVVRLSGPIKYHDSHTIYLDRIRFKKGILYPMSMTFFFPFDGGCITLFPK